MMKTGTMTGYEVSLHDPGIALIRFNRPAQLNGMSTAIKRNLIETLTQAQMDNRVRVLLFTGTGSAFCAGDDLKGYMDGVGDANSQVPPIAPGHDSGIGTYDALRFVSQKLNTTLRELDKLTVVALNGLALQSGFSLALACDFRIAARSARLGSATLRFGLLPDEGGQYLLVQLMGVARTMDFLMRKRIVSAQQAFDLGLVHEVVDDAALEEQAMALASELAQGPQVSMRLLKRSIYTAAEASFAQSLDEIAAKTAITDHHPDAREGVAAFREKRSPRFNVWLEQDAAQR